MQPSYTHSHEDDPAASEGFLSSVAEEGYGTSFEIADMWKPATAADQRKAARRAMTLSSVFYVVPLFVCIFGAVQLYRTAGNSVPASNPEDTKFTSLSVSFALSSEYGPCEMLDGAPVVEPHRMTTLVASVHGAESSESASPSKMVWKVDDVEVSQGNYVKHLFTEVRPYTLTLSLVNDGATYEATTDVHCKYVRREIRVLNEADRATFFDTLAVVYNVSTSEGQGLFGSGFVDIHDLAKWRLARASQDGCNGVTRGAGVHTQHAALAMTLESALQSVNPAVSLPYWDLAFDAEKYDGQWFNSALFRDHLFGGEQQTTVRPQVMANAEEFSAEHNAYGLLRPTWNNNPSQDVRRLGIKAASSGPSCQVLQSCFDSSELSTLNACLDWYSYNALSASIGGLGTTSESVDAATNNWLFQELVLRDLVDCPDACTSRDLDDCSCSLSADADALLTNSASLLPEFADSDNLASIVQHLDVSRTPGDLNSPVAVYDPLFWVLATGTERLLQQRLLLSEDSGVTLDQTWGYSGSSQDATAGTCSGHSPNDMAGPVLPNQRSSTNMEMLARLQPDSTDRP